MHKLHKRLSVHNIEKEHLGVLLRSNGCRPCRDNVCFAYALLQTGWLLARVADGLDRNTFMLCFALREEGLGWACRNAFTPLCPAASSTRRRAGHKQRPSLDPCVALPNTP